MTTETDLAQGMLRERDSARVELDACRVERDRLRALLTPLVEPFVSHPAFRGSGDLTPVSLAIQATPAQWSVPLGELRAALAPKEKP